jgi:hypothetical protein
MYPRGSIQTVEQADEAIARVNGTRVALETQYLQELQVCAPKFFTTSCVEDAKEIRRKGLAQVRVIEVESNTFKRRANVIGRDNVLAEKRLDEELEARRRAEAEALKPAGDASQGRRGPTDAEVIAEQKKRAENVLAFDRKQREAEARKREFEKKQAEKLAEKSPAKAAEKSP